MIGLLAAAVGFLPGGGMILAFARTIAGVVEFIWQTTIGKIAISLLAGYLVCTIQNWNDVRDALAQAARESRAAADAIDNKLLQQQLATARSDRDKLIELRDQDNAEDAQQIAELEREIAAGTRRSCLPSSSDARRLRLK